MTQKSDRSESTQPKASRDLSTERLDELMKQGREIRRDLERRADDMRRLDDTKTNARAR